MKGSAGGNNFLGGLGGMFGFGGARAAGGPVSAMKAYRVGEKGPETFIPTRPGMILPHQIPQVGTGRSVTINQTIQVNAEGAIMAADIMKEIDAKATAAGMQAVAVSRKIIPADLDRRAQLRLR